MKAIFCLEILLKFLHFLLFVLKLALSKRPALLVMLINSIL